MRIVIDLQGAQTESRFRGIGRYAMSFTLAIAKNIGDHELFLVLNGALPDSIPHIRQAFRGLIPSNNIRVWTPPFPTRAFDPRNSKYRAIAEIMRESFIAQLEPDVVHITSLFEGYVDDAAISIGLVASSVPVSVSLYDLIPLLNKEKYFESNPDYARHYNQQLEYLKKASRLLGISDFSRLEGLEHLPFSQDQIVTVGTAVEDNFISHAHHEDKILKGSLPAGIPRPFILYSGGADERKNLPRLVQAFSQLPDRIRKKFCLVLAGKISSAEVEMLRSLAEKCCVEEKELIFTGYVTDQQLTDLYSTCSLFVFPSWHEGFGLPTLEAMKCGAVVIASNTTSLPEVINYPDALFDPFNASSISEKISYALENRVFRENFLQHASIQIKKFSWDTVALKAIGALEELVSRSENTKPRQHSSSKKKLAFFSPLPPQKTGIATYSAQLLPELSRFYDVIVICNKSIKESDFSAANKNHDIDWFYENVDSFDRVVYQFGNSPFHAYMIPAARLVSGVVVLHDFFLSSLHEWLENVAGISHSWSDAIYASHGYKGLLTRFSSDGAIKSKINYPSNFNIVRDAYGILLHSNHAKNLLIQQYGEKLGNISFQIPMIVSESANDVERKSLRQGMGFGDNDFVVCSFGFMSFTKLNHRLIETWITSQLSNNSNCYLIFVGEIDGSDYGLKILEKINNSRCKKRIRITGYCDDETFESYLRIADASVQLRTQSRGETSAAVYHCMSHGIPTIVNACGSIAEIPSDCVMMMPEDFSDQLLRSNLEKLLQNHSLRAEIGGNAKNHCKHNNQPSLVALRYYEAIESIYRNKLSVSDLLGRMAKLLPTNATEQDELRIANAVNLSFSKPVSARRILVDITATHNTELNTGIERVARSIVHELILNAGNSYRIEPVYLHQNYGTWCYRFARKFTLKLIGCPENILEDEDVSPRHDDILIGLDLSGETFIKAFDSGLFDTYRIIGVKLLFLVHDILPIRMPNVFPPGSDTGFEEWLKRVVQFDAIVGVSMSVKDDLFSWINSHAIKLALKEPPSMRWSHHGADFVSSQIEANKTVCISEDDKKIIQKLKSRPSFLMVGTIEPRKNYNNVLHAFTQLWKQNIDANLVIVGKEGWKGIPDFSRRDIPETLCLLKEHPENQKRLFWLERASDGLLEELYINCDCLIAASYGEGFGLPLIEAARHSLPIIANDIDVFREVASNHAKFIDCTSHLGIATEINEWLKNFDNRTHICSEGMPFLSWQDSAKNLLSIINELSTQ